MKLGIGVFLVDLNKEPYAKNPQQPVGGGILYIIPCTFTRTATVFHFFPAGGMQLRGVRACRIGVPVGWSAENGKTLSGSVKWI